MEKRNKRLLAEAQEWPPLLLLFAPTLAASSAAPHQNYCNLDLLGYCKMVRRDRKPKQGGGEAGRGEGGQEKVAAKVLSELPLTLGSLSENGD